ncbi:sprouty homolog 2 [Paramuricea clavata]|uniref:Sprouty homolog 2 n=1 Tax=Paramuricea clavata TaxID=317549 RepID=A0A6S7FNP5_PARCT|nr:sprouty homolog 2 [Paramuricea clavata]
MDVLMYALFLLNCRLEIRNKKLKTKITLFTNRSGLLKAALLVNNEIGIPYYIKRSSETKQRGEFNTLFRQDFKDLLTFAFVNHSKFHCVPWIAGLFWQKPSTVANKLKSYDGTGADGNKLKDKTIDYTFIDEYCKVSGPVKTRDEDSKRREPKTNTTAAFGRPKVPFGKFVQQHIGGTSDRPHTTTVQPLADISECQQVQRTSCRNAENHETTPLSDCYSQEDITLECCGHNVETLVDYCTCMFCVKGLLYHCAEDSSCSDNVLDNPCSCSPVNMGCVGRWSMLGLLSVFLPCLMCYPLARGCVGVCKCYKEGESRRKSRTRSVQNRERERLT